MADTLVLPRQKEAIEVRNVSRLPTNEIPLEHIGFQVTEDRLLPKTRKPQGNAIEIHPWHPEGLNQRVQTSPALYQLQTGNYL